MESNGMEWNGGVGTICNFFLSSFVLLNMRDFAVESENVFNFRI